MNKLIQRNRQLKNRKGFTLIELIVVIAILGILAAVLVPQFSGFTKKAEGTQALTDASAVATAADAFLLEKGTITASVSTVVGSDAAKVKDLAGVKGTVDIKGVGTEDYTTAVLFEYKVGDNTVERVVESNELKVRLKSLYLLLIIM